VAQDPRIGREILPIPDIPSQPNPALHDDVSHMEDPEQTYHRILARQ